MPRRIREHDPEGRVEVEPFHVAHRLIENAAVHLLPLAIEFFADARKAERFVVAVGEQELHAADRAIEPSERVEPGREDEAHAACRDLFPLQPGAAHQCANSRALGVGEQRETAPHEHAVLSAQGRDVGDRGERDEVEHVEHHVLVAAQRAGQFERELEGHSNSREILVGRFVVVPTRIDHGERVRQRPAGQMVVGDDQVDSRRAQVIGGGVGRSAAVACEHHSRACRLRRRHTRGPEIVAVRPAVRNERHGRPAERADGAGHQRGRAHAVHVVIAVDQDRLMRPDRIGQALDGSREVFQKCRRMQLLQLGAEELLGPRRIVESAREEQAAKRQGQRESVRQ